MFLDKLLHSIGSFFKGLFDSAEKTWKKLSPELQDAMLKGSEVINTINSNLDKTPDFVLDIIKKEIPSFDIDKLKASLQVASNDLGIAESTNSDDILILIGNLQQFLSSKQSANDNGWAKASHTAYLAISVFLAPSGTKVAAIVSLAEYVYHALILGGKQ